MAFYKQTERDIIIRRDEVTLRGDFVLTADAKYTYNYPVAGWEWYESDLEAIMSLIDIYDAPKSVVVNYDVYTYIDGCWRHPMAQDK